MFKKIILGLMGFIVFSAILGDTPNAEARKYRSHYKLNYKVELDGVSADVVRSLCKIYPCAWQDNKAAFYRADIVDGGKNVPVFISKRGSKTRMRIGGLAHKEESLWKKVRIKGKKVYIGKRSFKIKNMKKTDAEGRYTTARATHDYIPTRYVKRACLKRRRCRKALYRYARKHARRHSRKSRYIPTSRKGKRRNKRRR